MKILITGGCGFVGSNLSILFKNHYSNFDIYCFDNLSRRGSEINLIKIIDHGINFIHGDVRIKSDFDKIPKIDLIIDAAAEPSVLAGTNNGDLENLIDTNLNGTINTLYFAKKHNASFIFLSTSRVYPYDVLNELNYNLINNQYLFKKDQFHDGVSENGINENFPLFGYRSMYGATKLASEYLIKEFSKNFNLNTIINRCGVISGPYQMGKIDQGVVVLWMARHIFKGNLNYVGYDGKGYQSRDVLHVYDLFKLLEFQIKNINNSFGSIFNVGGGLDNLISLKQLTNLCEIITGNKIAVGSVNENRPGDIPIYYTDNTQINTFSGWKPSIGVEQLLLEIFDWINNDKEKLFKILNQ
jgi:CDP-paratose 2-epimerase